MANNQKKEAIDAVKRRVLQARVNLCIDGEMPSMDSDAGMSGKLAAAWVSSAAEDYGLLVYDAESGVHCAWQDLETAVADASAAQDDVVPEDSAEATWLDDVARSHGYSMG